ncbi:MAG: redoxin domain-containing protein [Myxococcota bacterium]
MNWRSALIGAVVVIPLLVILALGFGQDPHEVPSVLEGKPAPAFELATVDGKPMRLEEFRGKPVVINFWSTWCRPCKLEHGLLQQSARMYGERVQFVGIVYQDELEAVRRYLQAGGEAYPQLMDSGSKVAIDYGVAGVPESFFIDATGVIRHKQAGVLTPDVLRGTLDRLLSEGAQG